MLALRQTGECTFRVPEFFFDLTYLGHYRRLVKAVRLTVPCVTGPFTNVGATLKLINSWWRPDPSSTPNPPPRALRHVNTIATSSAENDAGVFELNFRDERYMPFEGVGAIGEWKLTLPKNLRPFDYDTISDVILRINYTAEEDDTGSLRATVEAAVATRVSRCVEPARTQPPNTPVNFTLTERHLPFFLAFTAVGKARTLRSSDVWLRLRATTPPTVALELDGHPLPTATGWAMQPLGVYSASLANFTILGTHSITVTASGNLGTAAGTLLESLLEDILIEVTARVTP